MLGRLQVGDVVTVRIKTEAFYANWAGNPDWHLDSGDEATVLKTDVPFVRYHSCLLGCRNVDTAVLITWKDKNNKEHRATTCRNNLKLVRKKQ